MVYHIYALCLKWLRLLVPVLQEVYSAGYTAAFQYFINFRGLSQLVGEMKGMWGNRKGAQISCVRHESGEQL